MAVCKHNDVCRFYSGDIAAEPDLAALLKQIYCHGKHHDCARVIAVKMVGVDRVSDDLLPHDAARLYRLLGEGPEMDMLTDQERMMLRLAASR